MTFASLAQSSVNYCECPGYPLAARPTDLCLECYELDPTHTYAANVLAFWTADDGGIEFKDRISVPANNVEYHGSGNFPYGETVLDTGSKLFTGMPEIQILTLYRRFRVDYNYQYIVRNESYQNYGLNAYVNDENDVIWARASSSGATSAISTNSSTPNTFKQGYFITSKKMWIVASSSQYAAPTAMATDYVHGDDTMEIGSNGLKVHSLVVLDSKTTDLATRVDLKDNPWQLLRCKE